MKNKIFTLLILLSFAACILCTPVYAVVTELKTAESCFATISNSLMKNTVFKSFSKINFEGLTENILPKTSKPFDFSEDFAFIHTDENKIFLKTSVTNENIITQYQNAIILNFSHMDRLRTCQSPPFLQSFILLSILLYIGMLRAVFSYTNKNYFILKKPLFA